MKTRATDGHRSAPGGTSRVKLKRVTGKESELLNDLVVSERPVTIVFNDTELATLMCSPMDLDCLAIGFLFSEGLVRNKKDVKKMVVDEKDGVVWVETRTGQEPPEDVIARRYITTGCGKGFTFVDAAKSGKTLRISSRLSVRIGALQALTKESLLRSTLFRTTGGTHSAALCNSRNILVFMEDIGRHNAIDKVIGDCMLKGVRTKDKILVTSGRVSSEILIKAARSQIPVLVSKSAPTDLAIRLAKEIGIALIGFSRGSRMNIYSNESRVLSKTDASVNRRR